MTKILTLAIGLCATLPQVAFAKFTDLVCDDASGLQHRLRAVVGATRSP